MIIKLPTQTNVWDEASNKSIPTKGELKVKINNSALAHLKWEKEFQTASNGVDFMTAIDSVQRRISAAGKNTEGLFRFLSEMLRVLYCFIESDELPRFIDFVELVGDNPLPIIEKIKIVLEENSKVSSKN